MARVPAAKRGRPRKPPAPAGIPMEVWEQAAKATDERPPRIDEGVLMGARKPFAPLEKVRASDKATKPRGRPRNSLVGLQGGMSVNQAKSVLDENLAKSIGAQAPGPGYADKAWGDNWEKMTQRQWNQAINEGLAFGHVPVAAYKPEPPVGPKPEKRDAIEESFAMAEAWKAEKDKALGARPCTCHPADNPPRPCPQKYALSECRAAAAKAAEVEQAFARIDAHAEALKATLPPEADVKALDKIDAQADAYKAMLWPHVPLGESPAEREAREAKRKTAEFNAEFEAKMNAQAEHLRPTEPQVLPGIVPIPNPQPDVEHTIAVWAVLIIAVMIACTAAIVSLRPHLRFAPMDPTPIVESVDQLRKEQEVSTRQLLASLDRLRAEQGVTNHKLDEMNVKVDALVDAIKHTHYWNR